MDFNHQLELLHLMKRHVKRDKRVDNAFRYKCIREWNNIIGIFISYQEGRNMDSGLL